MQPINPSPSEIALQSQATEQRPSRHVFVDYKNIFDKADSPHDYQSTRVDIPALTRLFEQPHGAAVDLVVTRKVAGSHPFRGHYMWGFFERRGYDVSVSPQNVRFNEDTLADKLVAYVEEKCCILNDQEVPTEVSGTNTLVLASGDASFVEGASLAALSGWHLQIWSWRRSCAQSLKNLSERFPDQRISFHWLDDHKDQILFHAGQNPPSSIRTRVSTTLTGALPTRGSIRTTRSESPQNRLGRQLPAEAARGTVGRVLNRVGFRLRSASPMLGRGVTTVRQHVPVTESATQRVALVPAAATAATAAPAVIDEENMCIACFETTFNQLLLPCKHKIMCRSCARKCLQMGPSKGRCPMCRVELTALVDQRKASNQDDMGMVYRSLNVSGRSIELRKCGGIIDNAANSNDDRP